MPATALINGINYSWSNISVILFGKPVVGILSVEYKRKQKKENNYGAGSEPVSRGYGMKEYEGSIELYTDTWKAIIAAAPNRNPLDISAFDISVTFSGDKVITTRDVLRAVEFLEDPLESKTGDTKLTVKIPLIIGAISR
jgi:hypothetical protein